MKERKITGYLLKNMGMPVSIHWLKRDAVEAARQRTGKDFEWKSNHEIVKVIITEI